MSADPAQHPATSQAYDALRPSIATDGAEASGLQREAERIDAMIQSMWAGFMAAPTNGMPVELVDFVSAYTRAVRLKLALLGYAVTPRKTAARSSPPSSFRSRQP